MKISVRSGLLLCAACIMAVVAWGCGAENGSSIDNRGISVTEVKKITVRDGAGGITLSEGDLTDFVKMVNDFTLTGKKDGKDEAPIKTYSRGYCFDVEDAQGEVHSFVFFDQTMTVDLEDDYEISQEDLKTLVNYWKTHGLADMVGESHLPEAVLICKAYVEENLPELKLDWGKFGVGEINEEGARHGGFTSIEEPASVDFRQCKMAGIGDPRKGDHIYLIVDMQDGKVVAAQPGDE